MKNTLFSHLEGCIIAKIPLKVQLIAQSVGFPFISVRMSLLAQSENSFYQSINTCREKQKIDILLYSVA